MEERALPATGGARSAEHWRRRVDAGNRALFELGRELSRLGYRFTTPTPETHRRGVSRKSGVSRDLRDVFGWSLPFEESLLPARFPALLAESGALVRDG